MAWILMLKCLLFSLFECLLFAWLWLVSLGWCTMIRTIDGDEIHALSSSLVALSLSLLFFSLYNSSEQVNSLSLPLPFFFLLSSFFLLTSNFHR